MPRGKLLTEQKYNEIRKLLNTRALKGYEIAEITSVTRTTVSRIKQSESWDDYRGRPLNKVMKNLPVEIPTLFPFEEEIKRVKEKSEIEVLGGVMAEILKHMNSVDETLKAMYRFEQQKQKQKEAYYNDKSKYTRQPRPYGEQYEVPGNRGY